jgi:hypothetical protein
MHERNRRPARPGTAPPRPAPPQTLPHRIEPERLAESLRAIWARADS